MLDVKVQESFIIIYACHRAWDLLVNMDNVLKHKVKDHGSIL